MDQREYLVEFDYLTADRVSVSTTSLTFTIASFSLTVEIGKDFEVDAGQPVFIIPRFTGDVDHAYMRCRIYDSDPATGTLYVTVTDKVDPLSGITTRAAWIIRQPRKLRASLHGYTSPPISPSAQSNPNIAAYCSLHWPADLLACDVERAAFPSGATRCLGQPFIGRATVTLRNDRGQYDDLVDASFDGCAMRLMYGYRDTPYEGFDGTGGFYLTTIPTDDQHDAGVFFGGVSEQPVYDDGAGTFTIAARDLMHLMDRPLQPRKYGGTNSGGGGVDGESDIKGRPLPVAFGPTFNATPVLVNAGLLIYQVHYKALSDASSTLVVKDGLVALTQGATYADVAAMEATAPSAGQCRILNSATGVYIRLGSQPTHRLTVDVNNATWFTGGGNNRWLFGVGNSVAGVVQCSGLAYDLGMAGASPTCGIYITDDRNLLDVLGELALSAMGAMYANKFGTGFAGYTLEYNSGEYELDEREIVSLARRIPSDPERGIPAYYFQTKYGRNYTVMSDAEIAGAVSEADRKFAKAEDRRYATGGDAASKKQWLAAPEMTLATHIHAGVVSELDGGVDVIHNDAADHYGVLRHLLEVEVKDFNRKAAKFDLLNEITITHSRYGLAAGRAMRVLAYRFDAVAERLVLTLWG